MKINTIDIVHKTFAKGMFGYNQDEVNGFLQMLASQMEDLVAERNSLKETLRDKELRLAEYREKDHVLQTTITTAGQMAEKIRQDAERESRLIVSEAEQKAEGIVREARESLKKIYTDISELKRIRVQFESNLKALAQAHLSILEQSEKYLPNISVSPSYPINETEAAATQESAKVHTPVAGLGKNVEFAQEVSRTETAIRDTASRPQSSGAHRKSTDVSPLST